MGGAKRGLTSKDLERIHDEHVAAMFRYALTLLRDEASVRDLLQDIFLKLANGRAEAIAAESERAYLLRMVHHGAIDRMRRDKAFAARRAEKDAGAAPPGEAVNSFNFEGVASVSALPEISRNTGSRATTAPPVASPPPVSPGPR